MTAYSFGNKWMGIIALKESPLEDQEPLHKMARRLNSSRVQTPYMLKTNEQVGTDQLLRLIRRAELKARLRNDQKALEKYQATERLIRDRSSSELPRWLQEVIEVESAEVNTFKAGQQESSSGRVGSDPETKNLIRQVSMRETGWHSAPSLPFLPELPSLSAPLKGWLQSIGYTVREYNEPWLRLACVHSSYLYEHHDLSEHISKDVLSLLDTLGRRVVQVALLDTVRSSRGDFTSADEVHSVTTSASTVVSSLARELSRFKAVHFGLGEKSNQEGKPDSGAALTAARQLIGAMSLADGEYSGALQVVRRLGFEIQTVTDWKTEVQKLENNSPSYTFHADGPAHARRFHAKISIRNRSTLGEGSSKKEASLDAARKYIQKYFPTFDPSKINRPLTREPGNLAKVSATHATSVKRLSRKFEIDSYALISQSLIHSSWAHENKQQISISHQRANNVLAAEGSFILDTLACHQYVISTLRDSLRPTTEDRSFRTSDAETMADLAESFDLSAGILLGNGALKTGTNGTADTKLHVDALQAVIATAWRNNPGQLTKQQPAELSTWLTSLDSRLDAVSQLTRFTSALGIAITGYIDEEGPEHDKSYRYILVIHADKSLEWVGPWKSSSKLARRSTAQGILDLILSFEDSIPDVNSQEGRFYFLLLERQITGILGSHSLLTERTLNANLAIDLLMDGHYSEFQHWATKNEAYLENDPILFSSLQDAYDRQLRKYTKLRVLTWVKRNCAQTVQKKQNAIPTIPSTVEEQSRIRSTAAIKYGLEAVLTAPSSIFTFLHDRLVDSRNNLTILGGDEVENLVLSEASHRVLSFIIEHSLYAAKHTGRVLSLYIKRFANTLDFALRIPTVDLPNTLSEVVETAKLLASGLSFATMNGEVVVSVPFFEDASSALVRTTIATIDATITDDWFVDLHRALEQKLSKFDALQNAINENESADLHLNRLLGHTLSHASTEGLHALSSDPSQRPD